MKKLSRKEERLLYVLKFVTRFALLAIPAYLVMESSINLSFWSSVVASQVKAMMTPFTSLNLTVQSGVPMIHLKSAGIVVGVDRSCTGYRSLLAFASLVFAVPGVSWRKKLKPLLPSVLIVYAANLFRIVSTLLVGVYFGVRVFQLVHAVLWRWALTLLVLGLWVVWLKNIVKKLPSKNS